MSSALLLRARFVLPLVRPPIENGAVVVAGDRLRAVGPWPELQRNHAATVVDLGDSVLLPGFVNAHCHLEYTSLAGKILPPRNFAEWIKAIVALKAQMTTDDFLRSWQAGAAMLVRTGTTTVADIAAISKVLPAAVLATPLRVISFRELISLKAGPPATRAVQGAVQEVKSWPVKDGRGGLSPHAPYTTTPDLLQQAARAALVQHWRLVTHVAESESEFEMFMYRQGALYTWLKNQRDMADCGRGSPVQHLARCGYLNNRLLAVHANYLARDDAATLGRHHVSVAHCPRSHAYFQHLRFPREELAAHGVNLCLGTDSLATTLQPPRGKVELDMFAEMRALAAIDPGLAPATLLRLATVNGAWALGRERDLGHLTAGALADLIAVPLREPAVDPRAAVVQHTGPVLASMVGGKWAVAPPEDAVQSAGFHK
jgi:aminodeoxyfutalosine deaminase